jgi:hypothetical protein
VGIKHKKVMNETQKKLMKTENELFKRLKRVLDDISYEDIERGMGYYKGFNLVKEIVKTNQERIKTKWWRI